MILRVVVVVLAFFAGAGLLLYAAAWLFMPLDRTNKSLVSEALGADSTDRVRSVLTAAALLAVVAISAVIALDGGFVPGLLIALVVVAILLVVRRDENAAASGRPGYGPPGAVPARPDSPGLRYADVRRHRRTANRPTRRPQYGQTQYGQTQYGQPRVRRRRVRRPTSPSSTARRRTRRRPPATEPTVVTDPSAEPTVVTDPGAGAGSEPTAVLGQPPVGAEPTTAWPPIPSPSYVPPAPARRPGSRRTSRRLRRTSRSRTSHRCLDVSARTSAS